MLQIKRGLVTFLIMGVVLTVALLGMAFGAFTQRITDWENAEELGIFLEQDNTNERLFLRAVDGVIGFNNQCEDRAIRLIDNAYKKGKRLHFLPISSDEYEKWYGERLGYNRYHAIVGALVGDNEFWYIEPSNDKYWLALYLD